MRNENQEDKLYEHFRIKVEKGQEKIRIDKYLINRLKNTSRNRIQIAAKAGNILVNDKSVKANYKVKPGDIISILLTYPPREIKLIPQKIYFEILYEDEDIIVINKPANLVVHPGIGNYSGTLMNGLIYHLKENSYTFSQERRPFLVHRLDKDTTGIMVIAKNETALNKLAKQFYERKIKRKYLALIWGRLKQNEGEISGYLGRNKKDRMLMHLYDDDKEGKYSLTYYKVIKDFCYISLIECKLATGRTHQIRAHFSSIGHPLFGDTRYGGDKILRTNNSPKYKSLIKDCFKILTRQALHAKSLAFFHPRSNKELFFESNLPFDMREVINKWEKWTSKTT